LPRTSGKKATASAQQKPTRRVDWLFGPRSSSDQKSLDAIGGSLLSAEKIPNDLGMRHTHYVALINEDVVESADISAV
jgi:hypothetical protein